MKQFVRKAAAKALAVARNPIIRPIEVWALRAGFTFVAVKLGLDLKSAV